MADDKGLGVDVYNNLTNDVSDLLTALLMQETKSQMPLLDADGLAEEEDHDNILMDSVCELVSDVAKQQSPSFMARFHEIAVMLLAYCDESRPPADQAMGIGTFGS